MSRRLNLHFFESKIHIHEKEFRNKIALILKIWVRYTKTIATSTKIYCAPFEESSQFLFGVIVRSSHAL